MEWLHPIAGKQKVPIHVEIAAVVPIGFRSQCFQHMRLVQILGDPIQLLVAETTTVSALNPDIIWVLAGLLVGANDGVVAVDAGGNAGPHASRAVAAFDEGFAAGQRIVHGLAFTFAEDGRPAAVAAGHGAVVVVLR